MKLLTLLLPLVLGALALPTPVHAAAKHPNVLIVLLDDLGFSDLGCYGGEIPTPNIDALAQHGLRFTQMSNSARCCPSRASLLTGLHPAQAGIPNMGGSLNQQCATLAEAMHTAGYRTYAVGKWHVGVGNAGPTARGFDEFYGFPGGYSQDQWMPENYQRLPEGRTPELTYRPGEFYATDVFSDYALEFLRQGRASGKPWLLYLAYSSPHFPLQAPKADVDRFMPTYRRGWDVLREERFARMKQLGLIDSDRWKLTERSLVPVEPKAIANGYSGQPNPAWASLPKDRQEDLARRMALYAAMVSHVDAGVGRIVKQLTASGELDNTVILLLSDNGACYEWGPFGFDGRSRGGGNTLHEGAALDTMGGPGQRIISYGSAWANLCNTPFRLYKHFTHQGGIITPLIVHWPAGVQGTNRWVRDPAHVMDVMPTLVELADATYPTNRDGTAILPMEGVSLTPTFTGGVLPARALCYQHEGARAIRKGPWKLVMGKRFPQAAKWELYNLETDPCETKDLAPGDPERVTELAREWEAWSKRTGSFGPTPQGNGARKAAIRPNND